MIDLLYEGVNRQLFSLIDLHFAKHLATTEEHDAALMLLSALTSRAYGLGHTQLPRQDYLYNPEHWFADADADASVNTYVQALCQRAGIEDRLSWEYCFHKIKAHVSHPLTITETGIYLTRNHVYETLIVDFFKTHQLRQPGLNAVEENTIRTYLDLLFPETPEINWQKVAVANSLIQKVSVISGGPGTGKTTTVAKILLLLLLVAKQPLAITLAAPTGKAAARLIESLAFQRTQLQMYFPQFDAAIMQIPQESITLHRLLGIHPLKQTPKYHRYNPLSMDILIIDEASMVDLQLFATLLQALPDKTRLIILGDRNQLSSVEAGAVMAELCQETGYTASHCAQLETLTGQSLTDSGQLNPASLNFLTELTISHRFTHDSAIGKLAQLVNSKITVNKTKQLIALIESKAAQNTLSLHRLTTESLPYILSNIQTSLSDYLQLLSESKIIPARLFSALNKVRILCAMRVGTFGSEQLNETINQVIFQKTSTTERYHGQVIMILQNDYSNELYNGDIGIILKEQTGYFRAHFQNFDGSTRSFSVQRLPYYETAFAMTIHKAQGSEFDHIHLILSDHQATIFTTELFYTGITRAKHSIDIYAAIPTINQSLNNKTKRFSGISERLFIVDK